MTDALRLYRTMMKFTGQGKIGFNDIRNWMTFAWALVGLLLSSNIHLSKWAVHRIGIAKAESKERQFSRWLHNEKLDPQAIYTDLVTAALVNWQGETIHLALDTSMVWNRFVIVRIALVYRGRALPVAWKVMEHGSASVAFEDYIEVVRSAAQLLPLHCQVILLADRGFADVNLMSLCTELGWSFTIRAKQSLLVYRAGKSKCKFSQLIPPKETIHFHHTVQITDRRFGPVYLALGHVRTPNSHEQWLLISDRTTSLDTFDEYGLRFDIEESFLDDKSAGFQLESSQIRNADALSRLCLILATATLYLASTGTAVIAMNLRRQVDTHWHRGLSYFQIGWRWIRLALGSSLNLLNFLWLDPTPDPDPVFASRKQAAISPFAFSACYQIE